MVSTVIHPSLVVKAKTEPHSEDSPSSVQPGEEGTEGGGGAEGEFSAGATAKEGLYVLLSCIADPRLI